MHDAQAHGLRRAALVAAGLAATVVAHLGAVGGTGIRLMPVAPLVWGMLIAVAVVCGPRTRRFAPRGVGATLAALVAAQALMHVVASLAPWALGFAGTGMQMSATQMLTAGALWPHLAAALVLGVALVRADRLLARVVVRVHRALIGMAADTAQRPRPARRVPLPADPAPERHVGEVVGARGPPPGALAAI
jgi:hypothetical protein